MLDRRFTNSLPVSPRCVPAEVVLETRAAAGLVSADLCSGAVTLLAEFYRQKKNGDFSSVV